MPKQTGLESTEQTKGHVLIRHHAEGFTELVINNIASRNALSRDVLDALIAGVEESVTAGSRVLVITGSQQFFSAGVDIRELTGGSEDIELDGKVAAFVEALSAAPLVSIAAVEGGCIGAGFEIAAACDLRVADEASFFGFPALRMGLLYRPAAIQRTARLLGPGAAARMLLLGERLSGPDAYACGLITSMAGPGQVPGAAASLAARLCEAPPAVLHGTAKFLGSVVTDDGDSRWWLEGHLASFTSPARAESVNKAKEALGKKK
jgi:enoyl-CoA hydratase/carnithine racemase